MARLQIKGVKDVFIVDNEIAKTISKMKEDCVDGSTWINTGTFSGPLGKVSGIIFDEERTHDIPRVVTPPTEEELADFKKKSQEFRKQMGWK